MSSSLRTKALTARLAEFAELDSFTVVDDSSTYLVKVRAHDSTTAKILAKDLSKSCEVVEIGNSLFCWIKADYNWTDSIVVDYLAEQGQTQQEGTGETLTAEELG